MKQLSGCRAATCPQLAPFLYSRQPQGLESPAPTFSPTALYLPASPSVCIACPSAVALFPPSARSLHSVLLLLLFAVCTPAQLSSPSSKNILPRQPTSSEQSPFPPLPYQSHTSRQRQPLHSSLSPSLNSLLATINSLARSLRHCAGHGKASLLSLSWIQHSMVLTTLLSLSLLQAQ